MEPYCELQQKFRDYVGWGTPIACSSGTSALHLALESLELPKGSQVLVPEFTMVACARAVVMAGLRPVFVDCTDNLLMDMSKIQDYITMDTTAVMPVQIYGRSLSRLDLSSLKFAGLNPQSKQLAVIEDWAEHTRPGHSKQAPILSDALCWSFYRNKIIHGQEGGMILFNQLYNAHEAFAKRSLGFSLGHDFWHEPRGYNYRLANSLANLVLDSLKQVDDNLEHRQKIETVYNSIVPEELQMPARDVPWVYDLMLPEGADQTGIVLQLKSAGIEARHGFKPMSMMPEFMGHYKHLNAYRISERLIYLPITESMTEQDAEDIANRLVSYL